MYVCAYLHHPFKRCRGQERPRGLGEVGLGVRRKKDGALLGHDRGDHRHGAARDGDLLPAFGSSPITVRIGDFSQQHPSGPVIDVRAHFLQKLDESRQVHLVARFLIPLGEMKIDRAQNVVVCVCTSLKKKGVVSKMEGGYDGDMVKGEGSRRRTGDREMSRSFCFIIIIIIKAQRNK